MARLSGKVAVVTGSTTGIGRASAEHFAEEGASVVIGGRRRGLGQQVAEFILARGGLASYFCADVSQGDQVQCLIRFTVETYGRLDILVNNAYSGRFASVVHTTEQDWDDLLAVTVKAAAATSRYAIPEMIKVGSGSIINMASVHGLVAGRGAAAYAAAKAALISLTRQMAVDYGPYGIRVNALCPGRVLTEDEARRLQEYPGEMRRARLVYPLGRLGTPQEVAMAALFLASEESSFVTGHALVVDGGLSVQLQDALVAHVEEGLLAQPGQQHD